MPERDPAYRRDTAQLVRRLILSHFANEGCPPGVTDLAHEAGLTDAETAEAVSRAAQPGMMVLAPGGKSVWLAHPFSALPTMHVVVYGRRKYWASCPMDALAVGVLVNADVDVHSRCGDCGDRINLEVRSGRLHGDGFVHCPLPPSHYFDNVPFTCQTTQFFRDLDHVRVWCERHNCAPGEVATVQQYFEVASRLIAGRLGSHYEQPSLTDRLDAFASAGLDSEFWQTPRIIGGTGADPDAGLSDARLADAPTAAKLTGREMEVLSLLADALSQKQIAHQLSLSIHTVDSHIRNIYVKLSARSRAAAVATALRSGII